MKMNGVNDIINGSAEKDVSPSAIGTEFARQYYAHLVEHPGTVHKFYSHESAVLLNDAKVVGQQNIGHALGNLFGVNCRIKIHSVTGVATSDHGIALQVFGEMSGATTELFVQTFILAQQGAKKYYVQNDIFTTVNHGFKDAKVVITIPEKAPQTNGENVVPAPAPEPVPIPSSPAERPVPPPEKKMPVQNGDDRSTKPHAAPKKVEVPPKKKEEEKPQPTIPEPVPVVDNTPKSWATLVGGGQSKAPQTAPPSAPVQNAKPPQAAKPVKPVSPVKPQGNGTANGRPQFNEPHKLYLGGITRKIVPANTNGAENEIRDYFSKIAAVDNVAMPMKVLDQPGDTSRPAFAFITFKTAEDLQNVLAAGKKSERGSTFNLKVDAFGHDGEVLLSEQRGSSGSGFRGRGGFSGRGHTGSRGRTNGRGAFRGGSAPRGQN